MRVKSFDLPAYFRNVRASLHTIIRLRYNGGEEGRGGGGGEVEKEFLLDGIHCVFNDFNVFLEHVDEELSRNFPRQEHAYQLFSYLTLLFNK